MILPAPIRDKCVKFLVKIHLTNAHLFYNFFDRLAVINVSLHKDLLILVRFIKQRRFYKKEVGEGVKY